MICEHLPQRHIRQFGGNLPRALRDGDFDVLIDKTPCHFGGHRHWFLCPACERRCAILYPELCRHCVNGRYQSELRSPKDRRLAKAFALRRKLGQTSGGIVAPYPQKPKWMRWHSYLRIKAQSQKLEAQIWGALINR